MASEVSSSPAASLVVGGHPVEGDSAVDGADLDQVAVDA